MASRGDGDDDGGMPNVSIQFNDEGAHRVYADTLRGVWGVGGALWKACLLARNEGIGLATAALGLFAGAFALHWAALWAAGACILAGSAALLVAWRVLRGQAARLDRAVKDPLGQPPGDVGVFA